MIFKKEEKFYLPGLDGLRAMAVLMVIIGHVEGFKAKAHLPNFNDIHIIRSLAPQGVNIFFALSGFLITLLLLKELKLTGKIAVKKFYVRRILRIWPLFAAYVFNQNGQLLQVLRKKTVQMITYSIIAYYFIFSMKLWFLNRTFLSLLYSIALLNITNPSTSLINLELKIMKFIGEISYGMYIFHSLAIAIGIYFLQTYHLQGFLVEMLLHTLSIVLTIILSFYSYHFFEKKFLIKKLKYEVIHK